MTSYIRAHWEKVFNAAVDIEQAVLKRQEENKQQYINRYVARTTGILWRKRNYTLEEALESYENDYCYFGVPGTARIRRAKDLQLLAIKASERYDTNDDFVILSSEDVNFLFGD